MSREQIIQGAVLAALGCTTIDYRSPKRMDDAAAQIARFVEAALKVQSELPSAGGKDVD